MAFNRDSFISQYVDELKDNLTKLENSILAMKKDNDNQEALNELLRSLHTIKGSSRMLKFPNIEAVAHALENVFKGYKDKRYEFSNNLIKIVFFVSDLYRIAIRKITDEKQDSIEPGKFIEVFNRIYANESFNLDELQNELKKQSVDNIEDAVTLEEETVKSQVQTDSKLSLKKAGDSRDATIRIRLRDIDELILSVNSLVIKQLRIRKNREQLQELEDMLGQYMKAVNNQPGLAEQQRQIKRLVQRIKSDFSEQLTVIETNTFDVQEKILNTRMLPLELVLGSIPKMAEEIAMQLDKQIEIRMTGIDLRLDKMVLEALQDPLIHIIRNAIDHGLEKTGERTAAGKPGTGVIDIHCSREGSQIIIKIKDDGKGINFNTIRLKAIEQNPYQKEEIDGMNEQELIAFLFQPGFSTKSDADELSGRGVGLDIVKMNIEKVKGKISVSSEFSKGTEFKLILPLSISTIEGFFVSVSGRKFLVPASSVSEVVMLKDNEKIQLLDKQVFKLRNKMIPLYSLSDLFTQEQSDRFKKEFVLVVESLNETFGIMVDSLIEYTTLIYKPLPNNLKNLTYIQGIVFDEEYSIVNILYMPAIIGMFKGLRSIDRKKRFTASGKQYKKILVVDDSINTREIEKSMLEAENYQVETAVDGIDGLQKIRDKYYDLVISDLNMPRMDGFTMIENIKREAQFKQLPIIVISTIDDQNEKQKLFDRGINAYIVKSDFDQNNLITQVQKLIGKSEV